MSSNDTTPTIEIFTKRGFTAVIDSCDSDLALLRWQAISPGGRTYLHRHKKRDETYHAERMSLHRVILERVLGRILIKGEMVDHIDDNTLNNSRSNLRLASKAENMRNTTLRRNSTSGYKGVSFSKIMNKWEAYITVMYKKIHLGFYDTPEEAHKAYCEAAIKYHGEFARFE